MHRGGAASGRRGIGAARRTGRTRRDDSRHGDTAGVARERTRRAVAPLLMMMKRAFRGKTVFKFAAPPLHQTPCAHTAMLGTFGRSTFRFFFVLRHLKCRRTFDDRTSRKPSHSPGRASARRPRPEAPCSECSIRAWAASRRQQRLGPTHAGASPIRPCSARFRPLFARPWLYLGRIVRKPVTRWLHRRLFFRPARQL